MNTTFAETGGIKRLGLYALYVTIVLSLAYLLAGCAASTTHARADDNTPVNRPVVTQTPVMRLRTLASSANPAPPSYRYDTVRSVSIPQERADQVDRRSYTVTRTHDRVYSINGFTGENYSRSQTQWTWQLTE